MHRGQPVLISADRRSAGATDEDVAGPRVPEGLVMRLTHVAVEDETTTATYVRVGVERAGVFEPLWEQNAPANGRLYSTDQPFYLRAEDRLVARFRGSTSADKLTLRANGWLRDEGAEGW